MGAHLEWQFNHSVMAARVSPAQIRRQLKTLARRIILNLMKFTAAKLVESAPCGCGDTNWLIALFISLD